MKQMILKVNDDYTETVAGLLIRGQLVGSKSWYNKVLVLALSDVGILELEDKFEALELNWEVVAIEDEPLSIDEILPYMNDIIIRDEEGEQTDEIPFSDLSTLQTYADHHWTL